MIAVFKLIHGQKCYLYDEAGNIQLFPDVIAAKVGLAMNGIIEDRINSGEFLFEHWEDPEEVKIEPTENEKKMQEQIEQLDKRVKELEEIIGAGKGSTNESKFTLNSEVAVNNIRKKLKGD